MSDGKLLMSTGKPYPKTGSRYYEEDDSSICSDCGESLTKTFGGSGNCLNYKCIDRQTAKEAANA